MSNRETYTKLAADLTLSFARSGHLKPENAANYFLKLLRDLESGNMEQADTIKTTPMQRHRGAVPAVPIEQSIHDDHLICLEDGKRFKMLKRHLRTKYGMSPNDYRKKWGLPGDYPMVAPNYSRQRSDYALNSGLGRYDRENIGRLKQTS